MSSKTDSYQAPGYQAIYIWLDGTKPTAQLRSKMKVVGAGEDPPIWGFDGSSTNQAPGDHSDCVLRPVYWVTNPLGDGLLVLCEVLLTDMQAHPSNTRAGLEAIAEKAAGAEPWFGIEQEYNLFVDGRPLGFPDAEEPDPQGPYYCSVGTEVAFGRVVSEEHANACLTAGIALAGTNAEVMPGQWEFQVGPVGPLEAADQLIMARWLLHRIGEDYQVEVRLDAKPWQGDWNGAGAHTNFSTKAMRSSYSAVLDACWALGEKAAEHIAVYGAGIEERLTGEHETAAWDSFNFGVSDRGASVRIPWQVERDQAGYIEDRRPNANMDPYLVIGKILETCCLGESAGTEGE